MLPLTERRLLSRKMVSMVEFVDGDLLGAEVEALVNPVNTAGVMGKGLALQFKKVYPANFAAYAAAAKRGELVVGRVFVFETSGLRNPRFIINFPTKRHWREPSRLEDIDAGLVDLVRVIRENRIGSVALPALGCGLGGLKWADVKPMIERAMQSVPTIKAVVFSPGAVLG